MKKVAFYVNNSRFGNIDCRNLVLGNPGMGGTPYLIILVATELAKRNNGIDITLFVDANGSFEEELHVVKVDNCLSAINKADDDAYDYIVVNSMYINWDNFDFKQITSNLKIIPWAHNFNKYSWNKIFFKENKIAKFIAVSREQLDLLRDHSVFSKGDYIFNAVPYDKDALHLSEIKPIKERKHIVVYIGSLLWGKNFHVLASIWPDIISCVPDAQLFVIGTGNLYNEKVVLGKYGLAPEPYESEFMKYLVNSTGEILPSVNFLGKMGLEKFDVLREAKVAVPNPRGTGETFCISAVEMQLMGCNVTSMKAPGYFDTVYSGVLTNNKKELKKSIINLLSADSMIRSYDETLRYISDNFSIKSVIDDWEKLLLGDITNHIHPIEPIKNKNYRLKIIKEIIRTNHFLFKLFHFMPSIEYYISFMYYLLDLFSKASKYKIFLYMIKNKLSGKSIQI